LAPRSEVRSDEVVYQALSRDKCESEFEKVYEAARRRVINRILAT